MLDSLPHGNEWFMLPVLVILVLGMCMVSTLFWIWMLVDCMMNEPAEGNNKTGWLLLILFTYVFGALAYFLVQRPKRKLVFAR